MKKVSLLIVSLLVLFCVGCGSSINKDDIFTTISEDTTKADIERTFGKLDEHEIAPSEYKLRGTYLKYDGIYTFKFNEDSKLRSCFFA